MPEALAQVSSKFRKIHGKTSVPETLAQMFSYEFCEISKNSFFYRAPPVVAPEAFKIVTMRRIISRATTF